MPRNAAIPTINEIISHGQQAESCPIKSHLIAEEDEILNLKQITGLL